MSDSDGEYKVTDTQGRFAVAVREGRKVSDVSWTPGRVLLSNRRLILAGNDGSARSPLEASGAGGATTPTSRSRGSPTTSASTSAIRC